MLNEELNRIKKMMQINEVSAPLDYTAEYFIERIPFLKTFENFSDDKQVFFQKIDYNKNVELLINDQLVTFPQVNTAMEFYYFKRNMDPNYNDRYAHGFSVRNRINVMPPDTKNPEEQLLYRVYMLGLKMMSEKLSYSEEIITDKPTLSEQEIDKIINDINKTYFEFEEYIQDKLSVDINNPLNENLDEDYPSSFNMGEFKQLKSFNQRIQYCEQHLQRISSGSSRIVYKIDDEKVLKLAKNKKGLAQNEAEIDYGSEIYLESIVAKVFDYDERFFWLEMELARKMTANEFKRITGFEFKDFAAAILNYHNEQTNYRNGGKIAVDPEIVAQMWEDEFVHDIFQYLGNYNVPAGDLTRLSTFGIVRRNGQDSIVLVDYGLTDDVYTSHYKK